MTMHLENSEEMLTFAPDDESQKRLVVRHRVFFDANYSRIRRLERSRNSRTPIFKLNISELPLNKKETGNTLETRGLTYSYTFLTKPKNAHLECKGTKLFPNNQRVRLLFALLYINAA